jgi:hypothetical protein
MPEGQSLCFDLDVKMEVEGWLDERILRLEERPVERGEEMEKTLSLIEKLRSFQDVMTAIPYCEE